MPERFRDLPKPLKIYDLVLFCLSFALSVWAVPHAHFPVVMWLIAIFTLACLVKPIPHPYGGIIHPISGIVQVAALLWQPQDMLLAVGIGCFCGLVLFQGAALSRAGRNASGWAASAMTATVVAHSVLGSISSFFLAVLAAAFLSIITHCVINRSIFAVYRHLRSSYPFLQHLRNSLTSPFLGEFFPLPMIVVVAWAASLLRTVEWSLILTAVYLLVLPIPRPKAKDCLGDHELMKEVAEDALVSLSRSEQVGSSANALGGSLRRFWGSYSASQAFAALASGGPIAAGILATAEAYDKTRVTLSSLPRSVSFEDVEREFMNLTGTNPDPTIVPVLLSVAENASIVPHTAPGPYSTQEQ